MRIGIDIMGGDYSPAAAVYGSVLASKELSPDVEIVLFGNENIINDFSNKNDLDISVYEIIHTDQVVDMGEHPLKAFSKSPDASIFLGQKLLKKGAIDGFCSAGNTGAMLVGAMQIITPIPGIIRPAISAQIPNIQETNPIILDVGINPDARPDVLYQYGLLGSIVSSNLHHIENPRVRLLNIGEEAEKGNLVSKSTYQLMDQTVEYNFCGNMEANSFFTEDITDVLVCDGFLGNIVLKEAEAFYKLLAKSKVQNDYFEMFNFENFGGTPVLGILKPLVIGHGISNKTAIKNMILKTADIVQSNITNIIIEKFNR